MSTLTHAIYLSVVAGFLMALAGCADHGGRYGDGYGYSHRADAGGDYQWYNGYRYENGDRIDRAGHREARWCANHPENEHCH